MAVSPGGEETALVAATSCPTFSWGAAPGDTGFEVTVYGIAADGTLAPEPALRARMPRGSSSWTPSADRCLAAGRYVWTVRELRPRGTGAAWAEPRLFQVVDTMNETFDRAVERVLERWLAAGRLAGKVGSVADGGNGPPPSSAEPPPAATEVNNTTAGGALSFVADTTLYDPPDCVDGAEMFTDVDALDPRCQFIEQFVTDSIARGCTADPDGRFCPDDPVTRGQLAVYMERAMRGTATWDVNADLLDGLDSAAFLQLTGGTVTGALTVANDLTVTGNTTLGDGPVDTVTIHAGPVNIPNATSAADALTLGGDVNLYRGAANTLQTDDALVIGAGGNAISRSPAAVATLDFPLTPPDFCGNLTVTVVGAVSGSPCVLGVHSTSASYSLTCYVSAMDTVTVRLCNYAGDSIDPGSASYAVRLFEP